LKYILLDILNLAYTLPGRIRILIISISSGVLSSVWYEAFTSIFLSAVVLFEVTVLSIIFIKSILRRNSKKASEINSTRLIKSILLVLLIMVVMILALKTNILYVVVFLIAANYQYKKQLYDNIATRIIKNTYGKSKQWFNNYLSFKKK